MFVTLLWTRVNQSMSFSCWKPQSWKSDVFHNSRVEGKKKSTPLTCYIFFDIDQDMIGFLDCRCALLAHIHFFIQQHSQVLLLRDALNPLIAQPILMFRIALTQLNNLAPDLAELHEVNTSQACQGPSGWHLFPPTCWPHYSTWYHPETKRRCTDSHCPCHQQRSQIIQTLERHFCYWSSPGHWTIDNSLNATIQTVPYTLSSPLI